MMTDPFGHFINMIMTAEPDMKGIQRNSVKSFAFGGTKEDAYVVDSEFTYRFKTVERA